MLLVGIVVTGGLARASFPGENGLIVFDTLNGSASQIYTIRPNGSDLRQLTGVNEGGTAFVPHWSADGRLIVYATVLNVELYERRPNDIVVDLTRTDAAAATISRPGSLHGSPVG